MKNKIRILHVTFDMTIGGAQQVIRQLVENMDVQKYESDIVCIDNCLGEIGEMLTEQGVNIHLLDRQPGFDYKLILQLRKLIRQNNIRILHCHQYTPYFYGLLASIFTGCRVIFTEHGRFYPDYGSWTRKMVNSVLALFTQRITAISKATRQALVEHENFRAEDIIVIYNGIADKSDMAVDKVALKKEFSIPENAFLFGTISRLQPIKNQSMLIRAFKQVHDQQSNTHLLIVGDGEIRSDLEKLTETLGISSNVTFTGFQGNPYRFHSIIDVFLLSSFSEGTSMTLLEALSFSTPCVVTDVGGNPEIIINNDCGLVVQSDDMCNFAKAALNILQDTKMMNSLQINARKHYLSHFTVDIMVNHFLQLYGAACPK